MRTIRLLVLAGAIAVPVALCAAGAASASTWAGHLGHVGPHGVAWHSVATNSGRPGSSYHSRTGCVGPHGVLTEGVDAHGDGHGHGGYRRTERYVGPLGVTGGSVRGGGGTHFHHWS